MRLWYLLLFTWRAIGFELDDTSMTPFEAHGKRLEEMREKIAKTRKREPASDQLFREVLDATEAQRKIEGVIWALASRFAEEHGFRGGGWRLPPEWR